MTFHKQWKIYGQIRISGRTGLPKQRQTTINVWTHGGCIEGVLLEDTMPTKDQTFSMAIGHRVYNSQEESASAGDTWGYTLCTVWS